MFFFLLQVTTFHTKKKMAPKYEIQKFSGVPFPYEN